LAWTKTRFNWEKNRPSYEDVIFFFGYTYEDVIETINLLKNTFNILENGNDLNSFYTNN